jgi:hypothetical protein
LQHGSAKTARKVALVLADVGGLQLGDVPYTEHSFHQLRIMLKRALESIYQLRISPTDANLSTASSPEIAS